MTSGASPNDPRSFTRYERREHGPAFVSWIYEYWNAEPIAKLDGLGAGLEIGVQLSGEWRHCGARHGEKTFGPGSIHCIDPGERYALSFTSPHARSTQVGFLIYPALFGANGDEELRFAGDSGEHDRALLQFAAELNAGGSIEDEDVRAVLSAYVARHAEAIAPDPVTLGRRALDAHLDRDLRIEEIAEMIAMHPVTFARRFKARFGMTPVNYRLRQRLNHAARLTWSRPDLSIDAVAFESGFVHIAYFHRLFRRYFGLTPAAYAREARTGNAIAT